MAKAEKFQRDRSDRPQELIFGIVTSVVLHLILLFEGKYWLQALFPTPKPEAAKPIPIEIVEVPPEAKKPPPETSRRAANDSVAGGKAKPKQPVSIAKSPAVSPDVSLQKPQPQPTKKTADIPVTTPPKLQPPKTNARTTTPPKPQPPKIADIPVTTPPKPQPPKPQPPKIADIPVTTPPKTQPPKIADIPVTTPPKLQPPKIADIPVTTPPKPQPPKTAAAPTITPPKPQPPKTADIPVSTPPKLQPPKTATAPTITPPKPLTSQEKEDSLPAKSTSEQQQSRATPRQAPSQARQSSQSGAASKLGGPLSLSSRDLGSQDLAALPNSNRSNRGKAGIDARKDVEWSAYLEQLRQQVRRQWIPGLTQTSWKTVVYFSVSRSGRISNAQIVQPSGSSMIDEAALGAVKRAAPFAPLPTGYTKNQINIQFTFNINVYGELQLRGGG